MGSVESHLFYLSVGDLQAVKVDTVGGKILKWLQKESKNYQWARATCCLGCIILARAS